MYGGDIDSANERATGWRSPRRWLAASLFVAGLVASSASQAASCGIQVLELPVHMVGRRAVATVKINGTPVPLIVDSGAFFSTLTESAAEQFKLPAYALPFGMNVQGLVGKIESHRTVVDHLGLLNGDIPDVEFVVGINEMGAGAMGLLGRNILEVVDTEYDLAHGVIRFVLPNEGCVDANMAYWAGDKPVVELKLVREQRDRREKTPAIRAVVELNGQKTIALFDTGATTLVSLDAAHRAGVKDADMTPTGEMYGGGKGKAKAWTARFDTVAIGGEHVGHNRLAVGDYEMKDNEMLVGIDFFLSHRIYVSSKRARMFFTYNGGPVFALNQGETSSTAAADADAAASSSVASPLTADALARRGAASLSRGDLAGALADLDRACALEPEVASHFATRAQVHLAMRDQAAGLADLDAALRLDPAQADARITRVDLAVRAKEPEKALADLATLDQTLAPQSNLRWRMAQAYMRLERPAQALLQLDQWIAAHQNDIGLANALNSRCWARVELGRDLDKARSDCDDALDADPKDSAFLDSRGWLRLRQGDLQRALADFDRSLAIAPRAWSFYGRGLVHLGQGQSAAAQSDLAAARGRDATIDQEVARAGMPQAPGPAPSP